MLIAMAKTIVDSIDPRWDSRYMPLSLSNELTEFSKPSHHITLWYMVETERVNA